MTKALSVRIDEQGPASVMQLVEIDLDPPGPGEIQVRHGAIGVNFMDIYQRGGQYPVTLPMPLGLEAAGRVEAVGPDVDGLAPGDRVAYGPAPPGAYADVRNLPAARAVKLPDAVSDEVAAAVMLKGITVEYLFERARPLRAGETVLFYAAAGGVGLIAGQWGKALGARMIGIAGSAQKCALALQHGYEAVIDRSREDVVARVRELTDGAGVAAAFDSVGRATFEQTLDCLARRGWFVSFGTSSGPPPPVEAKELQHRGSLFFTRPSLADYASERADLEHAAGRVFDMVASGQVNVTIGQRYPLAEVVRAHEALEGAATSGSCLLIP